MMYPGYYIGKNGSASLDAATHQGGSNWVDPVTSAMDCATMQKNAALLQGQIDHFTAEIPTVNAATQTNLQALVDFQQAKLDAYNAAIQTKCNLQPAGGSGSGEVINPPALPVVSTNNNTLLLLAGGAALIFIIPKLMKK